MADKVWKARERDVAAYFGGWRIPVTGIDRHGADVETDDLALQVKYGRGRPAYLKDWADGIAGKGPIGVGAVVWVSHGESIKDALVVIRADEFKDLCQAQ